MTITALDETLRVREILCVLAGQERSRAQQRGTRYTCRERGCVVISKAEVDKILTAEIIGYLVQPEVYRAVIPENGAPSWNRCAPNCLSNVSS
ncbi:hypothetical protein [Streptomyces sp. NPDC002088]|uniref:hypothetical protein n=1 Tax=Streptomyces sp. NPDC002088 TaxID=3154665 RepID=UPI00332AAE83